MTSREPERRRRRSVGALAAVFGGMAATTSGAGVASHNPAMQGICIGAALLLIAASMAILVGVLRRPRC